MNRRNTVINKIIIISTYILLMTLFFTDEKYRVNHLFALIIVTVIYMKFKDCSIKRMVYYVIIIFAIMGAALSIPLSENFFLTRFNIYYLFIGLYAVMIFCEILTKKIYMDIKVIFKSKINILSILFIIYVFGTIIIADNKIMAIKQSFIYFVIFMLFIIIVNENRTSVQRRETFKILSYMAFGIIFLGSVKIITAMQIEPKSMYTDYNIIKDATREYMNRIPTVFFYNPDDYAVVLVLILVGYLGKIINVGIKNSKGYIVMYILGQVNLIYTCSRTGWISLVLGIAGLSIYFIFKKDKDMLRKCAAMGVITTAIFVGLSYISFCQPYYGKIKNTSNEISSIIKSKEIYLVALNEKVYMELPSQNKGEKFFGVTIGEENSINRRVTLIYDVLKGIFKEKRYFGFGIGNTSQYIMEQNNTYGLYVVHSLWFEILGDFGIIGLGLFIGIYVYAFIKLVTRKCKSSIEDNIGIVVLICSPLLVFAPSSVVGFTPFWIMLAMVYSNVIYEENRIKREEENE
ncbi:MAG: O-antigen ligase family protein [Clostridium sp.]